MPSETATYLAAHPDVPVFAIGGPAASAAPSATPIVGADRYATSVAVAKQFFTAPTIAGLANGQTFPDALAGDVENGRLGAPMLLVAPTTLPASVAGLPLGSGDHRFAQHLRRNDRCRKCGRECGGGRCQDRSLGEHVRLGSQPVECLRKAVGQ